MSWADQRGLGIQAKECLYERVIVPTALYGAESWGMKSAEEVFEKFGWSVANG